MRIQRKIFPILIALFVGQSCMAQDKKDNPVNGEIFLVSNNVENGVSQSNKDPALQGNFWYKFGANFRAGISGSNVSFPNSYSHLLLSGNADLSFSISSGSELHITYEDRHYFKPESRDGNVIGLEFSIIGYRILYRQFSNWFATSNSAKYIGFTKIFDVFGGWKWDNQVGLTMVDSSTYSNYFDLKSQMGYKLGNVLYFGGITTTSSPSQFNGLGDIALVIGAKATL